ncbi:MAG: helix-turn-helix domain-containing protein [Chloroflexota bacterium]
MDNRKYPLDRGFQIIVKDMNVSLQDVLRYAGLPLDLFSRKSASITADEFLGLWAGLVTLRRDNPTFPLDFATRTTSESFSPAIFASFCSPNLIVAAERIAYYKPLVGPVRLLVQPTDVSLTIQVSAMQEWDRWPWSLIAAELVWWVHIPRLATREHIVPLSVHTTVDIPEKTAYEDYFGVPLTRSDFNGVTFSKKDAERPFLTASDAMWSIFEPQLNLRMQDLTRNATYTERVRACLMEILAGGQYRVSDVASRLAVSPRTLQRYLRNEGTNFQEVLDALREELARNYLVKSDYSSGQIAFLLGYGDPASFTRAFRARTGQTPEAVRARIQ